MNMEGMVSMVILPAEELNLIKRAQQEILQQLKELRAVKLDSLPTKFLTAKEYMLAVKICRSKFDQLVDANKIKTIKKKRKIYVPISEVERYFNDPAIQ